MILDCGHEARPSGVSTGYATDRDTGRKICFACAADEDLKYWHANKVLTAYTTEKTVGSPVDVRIVTWAGEYLGSAYRTVSRAARKAYYVGSIDGVQCYGVGPAESGTYATFRPYKNQDVHN